MIVGVVANYHIRVDAIVDKTVVSTQYKHTVKPVLRGHIKRRPEIGFQDQSLLNAGQKYC